MSSAPEIVVAVTHRVPDEHGRRRGRVGYVQRLSNKFLNAFGTSNTGRYAAWARRTIDDVEVCTPELFGTYAREAEAIAHAKYAARVPSLSLAELIKAEAQRDAKRRRRLP